VVVAALVAAAWPLGAQGEGGAPTLDGVLARAAGYVDRFHHQLSGIVAQETYDQVITNEQSAMGNPVMLPRRRLLSDLLLVRPPGTDRYVELRDVYQVGEQPVRDREERLARLLKDSSGAAVDQIGAIVRESARYNIGNIERTINTPVLALMFLEQDYQPRFRFKRSTRTKAALGAVKSTDAADTGVFRVATEMWTVEYQERRHDTIVHTPAGRDLPARGRFWINPDTGAVLMSELVLDSDTLKATVTVSYQSEPLMGFLVPVEMLESYVARRDRVDGHAVYGRFRSIQ